MQVKVVLTLRAKEVFRFIGQVRVVVEFVTL
jgi:hypothetical protein